MPDSDSSYEAIADKDVDELDAFEEAKTDPSNIESVTGETVDGDLAVELPTGISPGGAFHDDVDGSDLEAIFDDESRQYGTLEEELTDEEGAPPDLVDMEHARYEERD